MIDITKLKEKDKNLEKEMLEFPIPKQDNILVLLWDGFPNIGEMLSSLEHWAENYEDINNKLGRKRREKIWSRLSFFFWKLRHKGVK